ncbi:PCMD domain-containing protein [Fluviicola taffensis]|uniref:PCMD domain-containing protein n=1 Tax=Fluviicola taffensis TaxID=191579 RepID=UPI000309AE84|nr:PCMD domain-containing protein [Fluviicola taffensis]
MSFELSNSETTANTVIDESNKKIFIYLNGAAYQNGVTPTISITKGATISPASGTHITFDQPVFYTVTSESGENKKTYQIEVVRIGSWTFNFENWETNPDNQYEYPVESDGIQLWSSANAGAALAGVNPSLGSYPTGSTTNGLNGTKAAKMATLAGTPTSEILGIHIIPGSIFLGDFNIINAFTDPLTATEFGQPYSAATPARFTGYYKYSPGPSFIDQNGTALPSETDKFSLYAVFYNGPDRLNGSTVNTSQQIIAKAIVPNGTPANTFVHFDIPFTFTGVTAGNSTQMAIIATSSYQGDQYRGAIGSELIIDSLRIIPE